METSKRFIAGVVLNVLALLAVLCSFPAFVLPVLKALFAGALMNPVVALLVTLAAFVVIDVGPVVGLVLAAKGRARGLTVATALASMCGLAALGASLEKLGLDVVSEPGHATGPTPSGCTPKTTDGSAVGRKCNPDGGELPAGDCPPEYFCMERVVDKPETLECMIYCRHDCECPDAFRCIHSKCIR